MGWVSSKRLSPLRSKAGIWQGPLAPPELPGFAATMSPADSRSEPPRQLWFPTGRWVVGPLRRVSQVPRGSVGIRRPLSPRVARPLHVLVASRAVSGFSLSGRLTTTIGVTRPERVRFRYG